MPEEIIDISSGISHVLILGKSGVVYTMGTNTQGELGTGNTIANNTPKAISLNNIAKVIAVSNTSYAVSEDGKIYAWGSGYTKVPKEISQNIDFEAKIGEKVDQISLGTEYTLILGKSGRAYIYDKQDTVTVVETEDGTILENIKEISAGNKYSVLVTKEGKVYSFGDNDYEKLGVSNTNSEGGIQASENAILNEKVQNIERVTAGYNHTSVYDKDGNIYTWGRGESGELGNTENFNYSVPQLVGKNEVQTNTSGITIKKGDTFDVDAWMTYFNLFEDKTSELTYEILDSDIGTLEISTGLLSGVNEGRTTVIVREVGTDKKAVIPVRVLENSKVEPMVETAGSHTIMLKADGTVWTFGTNENGELGTGNHINSDEPIQVVFPEGTTIVQVACGENHSLALDSEGNVWAWGSNKNYQLGNSNVDKLQAPTKVENLSNIRKIACGAQNSFAIGNKGEIYSFGQNSSGEGGIGSYTQKITVTRAKNISGIIDIKAGKNFTVALKSTGEVYVTGSNLFGELGQIENTALRRIKEFTRVQNINNAVMLGAGDTHAMVLDTSGRLTTWGSNNQTLEDMRYIDGGQGTSVAISKQGAVYVYGSNRNGELGVGNNTDIPTFQKLNTIDNVIYSSSGNTYTVFVKADGTVWGTGDYAHGDLSIKTKTKGNTPIQIGNGDTGLNQTEITVKLGEEKNLDSNFLSEFNLIYETQNIKDTLTYTSLRTDIAEITSNSKVRGIEVGTTRVDAVSATNQKTYSILVKVIPQTASIAPQVEGGDNFTAVLKADGTIWSFGYNGDGRLGIGSYDTKDIPTKLDMQTKFKDIKLGDNFIIAMATNGTVWAGGNNRNGQLGNGTTTNSNRLNQVQGITDAIKISAGSDFAQILDSYGNIYQIGGGYKTPVAVKRINGKVVDLDCGTQQSVYVTAKGKVYGYGNILNGEMPSVENAVKAICLDNKIIILSVDGEVYEYIDGTLNKLDMAERIIDIRANRNSFVYQTLSEDTFSIEAGVTNNYVIKNTGLVYAKGDNTYGSIGNGTRETAIDYVIVGKRELIIEPQNKSMTIGETEEIELKGIQFNVFGDTDITIDDYEIEIDDDTVVGAASGSPSEGDTTLATNKISLTALSEGIANITITDKLTGKQVTIKRKVERPLTDDISIKEITATSKLEDGTTENIQAKLIDGAKMTYEVMVKQWTDISTVKVTLNEVESEVSVDGTAYSKENGQKDITLDEDVKTIKIHVKSEAGTEAEYTLIIRKEEAPWEAPDINLVELYAKDGDNVYKANKVDETNYEVKVPATLNTVDVTGITEYVKDKVQIANTGIYVMHQVTETITLSDIETTVSVKVQSEDGTVEEEYTLKIIKMSQNARLEKVEVDGVEVTLGDDGNYHYYMSTAKPNVSVKAITLEKAPYEAWVNVANNGYELYETEKVVAINTKQVEVPIKVKAENGDINTYKLIIEGLPDDTSIKEVIVNGNKATYIEGKNRYEIREAGDTFKIDVTLNDLLASMELGENPEAMGTDTITVTKNGTETIVKVKVTAQNKLETEEYEIAILEKSANTLLQTVKVNGKEALQELNGIYTASLLNSTKDIDIEAIAEDANAVTTISGRPNNTYIAEINDTVLEGIDVYEYTIEVIAENGEKAEYLLRIKILEASFDILSVSCGENADNLEEATLKDDGTYYYKIGNVEKGTVKVVLQSEKSTLKINGIEGDILEVTLEDNITKVTITVIAEDKTEKETYLIIEKKSSDANIKEVSGEGVIEAEIEENAIYVHIEEDKTSIELNIKTKSEFAFLKLAGEDVYELASIVRTIDLSSYTADDNLSFDVNVKAEDGTEKTYTVYMLKESNLNLLKVQVNDDILVFNEANNRYEALVTNGSSPELLIEAEKANQKLELYNSEGTVVASGIGTINVVQSLNSDGSDTDFVIKVISANGEDYGSKEYNLKISQKSTETSIMYIKVDNLGTIVSTDGMQYSATVIGKEKYPVLVKLTSEKALVRLEDLEGNVVIEKQQGTLIGNIDIENGETKTFNVIVTAENGNEETYTLLIENLRTIQPTKIIGKILTENVNGEYIADVSIYREVENEVVDGEGNTSVETVQELYKKTTTNLDGTFEIEMYNKDVDTPDILEGKYTLVVTKLGYLSYKVTDIIINEDEVIDIGEYTLIAGDINGDEEITIADLVAINDYYGIIANIDGFDLNEDGTVNLLDRTILKKNYGKKAETKMLAEVITQGLKK